MAWSYEGGEQLMPVRVDLPWVVLREWERVASFKDRHDAEQYMEGRDGLWLQWAPYGSET